MKLFNYFGIGLVSLMLCAGFTSCGGDDEPEGGNNGGDSSETTPGKPDKPDKPDKPQLPSLDKRIVQVMDTGNGVTEIAQFTYNDKGELNKATHTTHSDEYFHWEGNTIKIDATKRDPARTYTLNENGMVASMSATDQDKKGNIVQLNNIYTYNNKGHLYKLEYKSMTNGKETTITNTLSWDGDEYFGRNFLKEIEGGTHDYKTIIQNSGNKVKGAYIVSAFPLFDDWLFYAHPERGGLLTESLPSSYEILSVEKTKGSQWNGTEKQIVTKYNHRENTYSDVKTDADGYITSIKEKTIVEYYTLYSFKDLNEDGVITPNEKNVKENKGSAVQLSEYSYTWEKK